VLVEGVLVGLKLAVTPEGKPLTDRLTAEENPLTGDTVTVVVPEAPLAMLRLEGEAERVKSAGGEPARALTMAEAGEPQPVTRS
jgi:hypothetical protein